MHKWSANLRIWSVQLDLGRPASPGPFSREWPRPVSALLRTRERPQIPGSFHSERREGSPGRRDTTPSLKSDLETWWVLGVWVGGIYDESLLEGKEVPSRVVIDQWHYCIRLGTSVCVRFQLVNVNTRWRTYMHIQAPMHKSKDLLYRPEQLNHDLPFSRVRHGDSCDTNDPRS